MIESLLLVLALSLDAFAASVAYGSNNIEIPFSSILVIDIICALFLGVALLFGAALRIIMPGNILVILSFTILMLLGIYYLFEGLVKASLGKEIENRKKVNLKLLDLRFIIEIYVDQTKADRNYSKYLNSGEALYLAIALSLDSLAAGFGSSIVGINFIEVILMSFIWHILAIKGGVALGQKLAIKSGLNLSWLSGVILIILATMKLF